MLQKLERCFLRLGVPYSVYSNYLCGDSLQDILSSMCALLNDVVENVEEYNKIVDGLKKWIEDEGIQIAVNSKLESMIDDGTFDNIINQKIFSDLSSDVKNMKEDVELNSNYRIGVVNIHEFKNLNDGEYWDNAIKEAINHNTHIYFPKGTYLIKEDMFLLNQGNVLIGEGVLDTSIVYVGEPKTQVGDRDRYLFKLNNHTGFKNIKIATSSSYAGKAIYLDASRINAPRKDYVIDNVHVAFKYKSGYGWGLGIKVKNFDDNGVVYTDGRPCSLVYLVVNNFECSYGERGISFEVEQRNPVANRCWATACSFNTIRLNTCVYGLYLESLNTSSVNLLDVADLKFNDVEVQLTGENYFESTTKQSTGLYINGSDKVGEFRLKAKFVNLMIWDSPNGVNGLIKNAEVLFTSSSLTRYKNDENHYYGFEKNNNVSIDFNADIKYDYKTDYTSGKKIAITPIKYGQKVLTEPDKEGYSSGYEVTCSRDMGDGNLSLYPKYNKKVIDANKSVMANHNMGNRINELTVSDNFRVNHKVISYGYDGIYQDGNKKSFVVGNNMKIYRDVFSTSIANSNEYVLVSKRVPKATFSKLPFIIGFNVDYSDTFTRNNKTVDIRNAYIIQDDTDYIVSFYVKHSEGSPVTIPINFVICGLNE